jgi:hypothetical protein
LNERNDAEYFRAEPLALLRALLCIRKRPKNFLPTSIGRRLEKMPLLLGAALRGNGIVVSIKIILFRPLPTSSCLSRCGIIHDSGVLLLSYYNPLFGSSNEFLPGMPCSVLITSCFLALLLQRGFHQKFS